jgi:hypothetical protein
MAPRTQSRRTIDVASLEIEIARLGDLDLKALRLRWQGVTGRSVPVHLPKHLLLAMLSYRIQADAFGDLDAGMALNGASSLSAHASVASFSTRSAIALFRAR